MVQHVTTLNNQIDEFGIRVGYKSFGRLGCPCAGPHCLYDQTRRAWQLSSRALQGIRGTGAKVVIYVRLCILGLGRFYSFTTGYFV